ncbi:MAG TPA: hypothetical protein ENH10_07680, partial [Bacteroidetes bacterium]|nr:hypothetical protein [Bacteroidota bacterium]HEX05017.1 hypothetical protein [Bacteroidota bacterium]
MRSGNTWMLMSLVLLLGTSSVFADIPINERVSIDGSIRVRGFFDERDFDWENTDAAYYSTMRSMIGFKIQATDDVLLRLKIKDSRYMGVPYSDTIPGADDATITNTANSSYLTLQE